MSNYYRAHTMFSPKGKHKEKLVVYV